MSQQPLPFDVPAPVWYARMHAEQFTEEFMAYIEPNLHVYTAFEREALAIARRRPHYSARTIVEVLRHNSALQEVGGQFKLSDWHTPYLARLFVLIHPQHVDLFEFRITKPQRERATA